jgi:hypothetical protein
MLKKFQRLVKNILEDVSAGPGGAFGTPQTPIYNPPSSIDSGDTYATDNAINIFGFASVQKRKKPELLTFKKKKKKKGSKKK